MTFSTAISALAGLSAALGALFMLLAGVGMVRFPDLFTRMSATSKAGSLGCGLLLLSAALAAPDLGVAARALAAVAFVLLTAPVASHRIGRAAYALGVPLWKGTVVDELRPAFDRKEGE